jgi:hypothetical protein
VLECEAAEGGPIGGNGVDDSVTKPGLYIEGEQESLLETTEVGFELLMVRRSAASNVLGLATALLLVERDDAVDCELVNVKVK